MTKVEADLILYGFMAALSVCGLFSIGKHDKTEKEELEAHELVVKNLPDANLVGKVEFHTLKNLRDQTTPEEMAGFEENLRLLQMGDRRN